MQCDEMIWSLINNGFCSYKIKTNHGNYCKNPYNLTGLCRKEACPLGNSRYATIMVKKGICYLYMKTIERAHTPAKLWERVKLPKNYAEALKTINRTLQYWPKFVVHKCKQRLTKITQYLIRMRKIKLKSKTKLVPINKKTERREARKEEKAEVAARIEKSIETELLERLKKGAYGDIYNFPQSAFENALEEEEIEEDLDEDKFEEEKEEEDEDDFVEALSDEELEELEMEDFDDEEIDFGEEEEGSDDEEGGDDDDEIPEDLEDSDDEPKKPAKPSKKRPLPTPSKKAGPPRKRAYVEVEYEEERQAATH